MPRFYTDICDVSRTRNEKAPRSKPEKKVCVCGKSHLWEPFEYLKELLSPTGRSGLDPTNIRQVRERYEAISPNTKKLCNRKERRVKMPRMFAVISTNSGPQISDEELKASVILDQGSEVHIANDRNRFVGFLELVVESSIMIS
ncbi:hypothetical protein K470DRAFT_34056 [Piedraia hortae CBS 480.64]|uniref:Uncharacterized protein n=1 Tax=Piedraia hortae CBS 480.64 TaxID=1314780 RepID=A0A6A7C295_9PEZI|nr:hypothetical protein K470DRAFT_34056 [Piedraia hortae CBS 480.64]